MSPTLHRRAGVPRYCDGPCCAPVKPDGASPPLHGEGDATPCYARQTAQSASGEKSGTSR